MFLLLGLRRVSRSFNTLIRYRSFAHRPFTTQSCSRRVLFSVGRQSELYFYSAKIQKDGTLCPATMLPPIPSKELLRIDFSWSRSAVLGGKIFLRSDSQIHIYSPDTGEYSTLPDVPLTFPVQPGQYFKYCYFGFDTLSNEPKALFVQNVWLSETSSKWLFWVFTRGSGSWSQIHSFPKFDFPRDLRQVVFANGAIHCICDADAHLSSRRGPSKKHILAFDMVEGGQLRKFPHPDDSFPGELTQFGGRLALIEDFSSRESSFSFGSEKGSDEVEYDKLRIWILEDYKNLKWVKETIHLPFGWMRYNHLLAFDYNTGEMLLKSQGVAGHFLHSLYFIYYNTKTGTFRREEVTGFPNWVKEDRIYSRVVEVNFDDEMDRQKSF